MASTIYLLVYSHAFKSLFVNLLQIFVWWRNQAPIFISGVTNLNLYRLSVHYRYLQHIELR